MGVVHRSWGLRVAPLLVFVAGGGLLFFLAKQVRVPAPPLSGSGKGKAPELVVTRIERLPVGTALREKLQLLDPSPLFMPGGESEGLAGAEGVPGHAEGNVTGDFPPALRFSQTAPAAGILRPEMPATPLAAAERLAGDRWFDGLARQDDAAASEASAVRAARVEVYALGEAERVAAVDLAKASGLGGTAWRPLTLTVLMDAAGAVTRPVVATSSGIDEVDERIRWIVGHELLPRLRLRPGIYRLEVGP